MRLQDKSTTMIANSRMALMALCCWLLGLGVTDAQPPLPLQHAWELSPNFGDIWSLANTKRPFVFNVENLDASEIEQRLHTARLICINYDRDGFQGGPRAIELLLARLSLKKEPLLVQRAMMSAACHLDDGTHADQLWEIAQGDSDMRTTVERSLVKWRKSTAIEAWRERIRIVGSNANEIALALEGLAVVGSEEDRSLLLAFMRSNSVSTGNRFLASCALGSTNTSGLNGIAEELLQSNLADRFSFAANLLRKHSDEKSLEQLLSIVNQGPATSRRVAAEGLVNQFFQKAMELAPSWAIDPDNNLRRLALKVLNRIATPESLKLQGALLGDPNLEIRNLARTQLLAHADGELRPVVDSSVSEHLAGENWRGIEQAVILSTQLRDRTRCDAFLDLLEHPKPEVHMHASWGLMEMAEDPKNLEEIHRYCEKITEQLEKGAEHMRKSETIRLSFLLETLGKNRYVVAEPMLTRYIPKQDFRMGNLSRASAIWALGQIAKDKDDPALRAQLRERIQDLSSMSPENYLVGYACMLAVGEFGYKDCKETLQRLGASRPSPLGYACEWAIERIDESGK